MGRKDGGHLEQITAELCVNQRAAGAEDEMQSESRLIRFEQQEHRLIRQEEFKAFDWSVCQPLV